jgi:hypothetical protein
MLTAVTSNAAAASTPARRRAWIKVIGDLLQKPGLRIRQSRRIGKKQSVIGV